MGYIQNSSANFIWASAVCINPLVTELPFGNVHMQCTKLPYSGKLSREKTFADWWKIKFRGENFRGLLSCAAPPIVCGCGHWWDEQLQPTLLRRSFEATTCTRRLGCRRWTSSTLPAGTRRWSARTLHASISPLACWIGRGLVSPPCSGL